MKRKLSVATVAVWLLLLCGAGFLHAQSALELGTASHVRNSIIFQNTSARPVSEGVSVRFSASDSALPAESNNVFLSETPFNNGFRINRNSDVFDRGNRVYLGVSDTLDLDFNPRVSHQKLDIGAFELVDQSPPTLTLEIESDDGCFDDDAWAFVHVRSADAVEPLTISWNTGATSRLIEDLTPGTYSVMVTDARGAMGTALVTIGQTSLLHVTYTVKAAMNDSCDDGRVDLFVVGGEAPYFFEWTNARTDEFVSDAQNLTHAPAGVFNLVVADNRGCEQELQITLQCEREQVMPSVLVTPNNDGMNDYLYIQNIHFFPINTVTIIDSYGAEITTIENFDNRERVWNGTNRRGQYVPDGTYWYVVQAEGLQPMIGWIIVRLSPTR